MITNANTLICNLNTLFMDLEVNLNTLSYSYYITKKDNQREILDAAIDEKLALMNLRYNSPDWLMQESKFL